MLQLDPHDTLGAARFYEHLTDQPPSAQALSAPFIATLFDGYAARFDSHLLQTLDYKGPELVMEALKSACHHERHAFWFERAVDAGCGTGLMGARLRPFTGHLSGCDLSSGMLDKARTRNVYDHLTQMEMTAYINSTPSGSLDLVTAVDVCVYMGDMTAFFAAIAQALRLKGHLAFTVQHHQSNPTEPFVLGNDHRYAHSQGYLLQLAQTFGFECKVCAPCTPRFDNGQPVEGLVLVLQSTNRNEPVDQGSPIL